MDNRADGVDDLEGAVTLHLQLHIVLVEVVFVVVVLHPQRCVAVHGYPSNRPDSSTGRDRVIPAHVESYPVVRGISDDIGTVQAHDYCVAVLPDIEVLLGALGYGSGTGAAKGLDIIVMPQCSSVVR